MYRGSYIILKGVNMNVQNSKLEEEIKPLLFAIYLNSNKIEEWLTSKNTEFMGYTPLHVIENGGAELVVGYLKRNLGIN
jgi:hypothetical protein